MSIETLKGLIDIIDDSDIDTIYKVLLKFIPEAKPLSDEVEAIERANKGIAEHDAVPHDAINWD